MSSGSSADLSVVVVTGIGRFLGAQVASRLAADPRVGHVIGVDAGSPPPELAPLLARVELVESDLTACATVVANLDARAVVHLGVVTAPDPAVGGRAGMKEQNVIGTMQLLAACQRAPRLRKLVVRSSTAAYGASFRDPAVFTEETEPREVPRGGFARDILDIEGYVRGFRRHCPEVTATVLRLAPLIGPAADTTLTRYFAQPVVPTVLGRDPRLQFVHVQDALEILHRSVVEDHPGTFNVAGPGVLTLNQAIRRAGRLPVPVIEPGLSAAAAFGKRLGRGGFGLDQLDLFVHGRVVDTTRLTKEYGVTPRSTAEAFAEFLGGRRAGIAPLGRDRLEAAEQAILRAIARVRGQGRPA
ncbi:MAG: NAD-dependent epimerase/dehydratase family protein [Micromonosporaceae bacterium]|nr:NAD-dependent epimerase/dehydratase family protein [Micromonosporaceae bacterium]